MNEIITNKKVVLTAIQQHGLALKFASETLKNDKEIVLFATQKNEFSLQYASEELINIIGTNDPVNTLKDLIQIEQYKITLDRKINYNNKRINNIIKL